MTLFCRHCGSHTPHRLEPRTKRGRRQTAIVCSSCHPPAAPAAAQAELLFVSPGGAR